MYSQRVLRHAILATISDILNTPNARPLLILLPGLDGTGKLFRRFIDALGTGTAVRVASYPVDEPLGYEDLEARVWLTLPRDRPYVILGESFSGPIAIRLAARQPPGLIGLILCGTFAKNPFPGFAWAQSLVRYLPLKSMPRWLRAPLMWGSSSPTTAPPRNERGLSAVAGSVLQRRISALLQVDATAGLQQIATPMLILQASHDWVVPKKATQLISRLRPDAKLLEIEGPHLLLQARAAVCAAAVIAFLDEDCAPVRES